MREEVECMLCVCVYVCGEVISSLRHRVELEQDPSEGVKMDPPPCKPFIGVPCVDAYGMRSSSRFLSEENVCGEWSLALLGNLHYWKLTFND